MLRTALAATAALGDLEETVLRLVGGLAALILILILLVVVASAALLGVLSSLLPGSGQGGLPAVPPDQLAVMREVEAASGVPWELLAAIASVESGFGRNMATSSAGAIGYGQFLPASWAAYGAGGDPYDYRDALPAMARYLFDHGVATNVPAAVYAYNHSWQYVTLVLRRAAAYADATSPAVAARAPAAEGAAP